MYTYVSSFVFLCLLRWLSVPVLGYIITHCMSIYVSGSYLFLSFSLNICSSDRLYYYSLYVYMSDSWVMFILRFSVSAYTVTDCSSIRTSFDPCLSLSFCGGGWGGVGCGWMFLSYYDYIVTDCTCKRTSLDPGFSLCFFLSVRLCTFILSGISCMWKSAFSSPSV